MALKSAAYLGPEGSYSERALRSVDSEVKGLGVNSIPEIFTAVREGQVDFGVAPIENLIEGPVTASLDQLHQNAGLVYIADSFAISIEHCLGVKKGDERTKITHVHSHEQALRQCSRYLQENYPEAARVSTSSTGAAAAAIAGGQTNGQASGQAVIASRAAIEKHGLVVRDEEIADTKDNQTRFLVLKKGDARKATASLGAESATDFVTSIVVDPGRDRQGLLFELLNVISVESRVNLLSIHSRPDGRGGFVFFFDLEGHLGEPRISNCIDSLHSYCLRNTGETAEILLFGSYRKSPFIQLPFKSIGIIGGLGVMGKWFQSFFTARGLEVAISDRGQGISLEELVRSCDVILISVPMSAAPEVARALVPLLKPGQLVVENCSIKSAVLPELLEVTPPEVEVLGLHTMFGGDIESLREQNIIVTKTERSGEKAQALEDLFYKHGAHISHLSIDEHDNSSAYQQSLVHLVAVILAEVLRENFESVDELRAASTPNSRALNEVLHRVLDQTEPLLSDLQLQNDRYAPLRSQFLSVSERLVKALSDDDVESFLQSVRASRQFLNKTN